MAANDKDKAAAATGAPQPTDGDKKGAAASASQSGAGAHAGAGAGADSTTTTSSEKHAASSRKKTAPKPLADGRKPYQLRGGAHDGVDENGARKDYVTGDTVYLTDQQYNAFAGNFVPLGEDGQAQPYDANQVKDGSLILSPHPVMLSSEQVAAENAAKVVGDPHEAPAAPGNTVGFAPNTAEAARNQGAAAPQAGGTGDKMAVRRNADDLTKPENQPDVATGASKVVPASSRG
jgi:hypothetical protein